MSYLPTFSGEMLAPQWLYDELQRIATEMVRPAGLIFEELHAEPDRPQDGTMVFADGTDWNPGSGAGIYHYRAGVWHYLG